MKTFNSIKDYLRVKTWRTFIESTPFNSIKDYHFIFFSLTFLTWNLLSIPSRIILIYTKLIIKTVIKLSIPSRIIKFVTCFNKIIEFDFQFHQGLSGPWGLYSFTNSSNTLSIPSRIILDRALVWLFSP